MYDGTDFLPGFPFFGGKKSYDMRPQYRGRLIVEKKIELNEAVIDTPQKLEKAMMELVSIARNERLNIYKGVFHLPHDLMAIWDRWCQYHYQYVHGVTFQGAVVRLDETARGIDLKFRQE